jgi:hypothetical protein
MANILTNPELKELEKKSLKKIANQEKPSKKIKKGPDSENIVSIPMYIIKIQDIAYDLSQQPKTYDDYIWLLAENELRLNKAYLTHANPLMGVVPESVSIYPSKLIDFPETENIKRLAEIFAAQGPNLQDLHWFLAERVYIYNSAKKYK